MYKKGVSINKEYKMEEKLGEGSFAVVSRAVNKKTNEQVAVKIVSKSSMTPEDELALQNEVEILTQIDHPNVVKLHEIFEDDDTIFLVLELMFGGELFDRIVDKEHYSEKEASDTIRPIVDALRYCHTLGIAHRDLKPENLLYSSKDQDAIIKISDFGLAKFMNADMLMTTACGTPGYVAPEVLCGKGYDKTVDFWSVGVILYIMLCGFPPFYADTNKELFDMIKKGEFDFPSPYWDVISDMAKDLIRSLLVVDPPKRLEADQILNHPWVLGEKTPRQILPNVTKKIREFNAKRKWKKAVTAVMAAKKWEKLIKKGDDEETKE